MKKPIRILTTGMDIVGEIDNYESMFFNRSWHGIGGIELRINRHMKYANTLLKNNLILIGTDLNKVFIIKHREVELNEEGKITENWLIKGYALKSIIAQRITMPPSHTAYDNKSGSYETVMKHYVNANLVNPVDSRRKIPQLVIAPDLQRGAHTTYSSRFKNLAEEMSTLSLASGLGWDITLDIANKQWVFDIVEGRNLIAGQSLLPPVIFSPQFESLKSMQYVQSELNYKNTAYVAGQGEGVERRVVELGNHSAIDRHEIFIDARDIAEADDDEQPLPEQQIVQALTDRGRQQLNELLQEEYLEAQIFTKTVNGQSITTVSGSDSQGLQLQEKDLYRDSRNMLVNTGYNHTPEPYGSGTRVEVTNGKPSSVKVLFGSAIAGVITDRVTDFVQGEVYTLTLEVKTTDVSRLDYNYYMDSNEGNYSLQSILGNINLTTDGKWHKYTKTFISPASRTQAGLMIAFRGGSAGLSFELRNLKLEKGNIATPWQPAPEDSITWYENKSVYKASPIDLSSLGQYESSNFMLDVSLPNGTNVITEFSFDNENWAILDTSLPFEEGYGLKGKLYIRHTLTSNDSTVTPIIKTFDYNIRGLKLSGKTKVTTGSFEYEKDWGLGDIVTIQNKDWGVTMDARITDIKEIYEMDGFSIEATFGNSRPTLIQKIKQELSQISGEVRR